MLCKELKYCNSILVIYCCTKPPKRSGLIKQQYFIIYKFVGDKFGEGSVGQFFCSMWYYPRGIRQTADVVWMFGDWARWLEGWGCWREVIIWPLQHGSVRVVRPLSGRQLRAPSEGVLRGSGRSCKEPSFRSPTVSLPLHSVCQTIH